MTLQKPATAGFLVFNCFKHTDPESFPLLEIETSLLRFLSVLRYLLQKFHELIQVRGKYNFSSPVL
jgi:hypothetical protein